MAPMWPGTGRCWRRRGRGRSGPGRSGDAGAAAGVSQTGCRFAGEHVVDVPPKLPARTRVFATGQGRKTDATDAHSVALAATGMTGLRQVVDDQQLAVLRILAGRRRSLGEDHTPMVSPLHQLLLELIPRRGPQGPVRGPGQGAARPGPPRESPGQARRRAAAELTSDLGRIYQRKKEANRELTALLAATGTTLTDLHGIGPPRRCPPAGRGR